MYNKLTYLNKTLFSWVRTWSVTPILSLLAIMAPIAHGQENPETVPIEESDVVGDQSTNPATSYIGRDSSASSGLSLSVQETPQMISVFTQKRIEDQGFRDVNDVLKFTPGVSSNAYDDWSQYYYSRGTKVENFLLDGYPSASVRESEWGTVSATSSTAIYEQIEVIKGATGMSTGIGNPSASVNLVRKKADFTEFTSSLLAGGGNNNSMFVTLDVGNALNASKTLRGRLVVDLSQEDSFRLVGDDKRSILYLTTEADIGDGGSLSTGITYQKKKATGVGWGGLKAYYADGTLIPWDRTDPIGPDWSESNVEQVNFFKDFSYQFNDSLSIKSHFNIGYAISDILSPNLGAVDKDTEELTVEQFPSKFDSKTKFFDYTVSGEKEFDLFGHIQKLYLGGVYSKQTFKSIAYMNGGVYPTISNIFDWDGTGYPEMTHNSPTEIANVVEEQIALLGSGRLQLTEKLKFIIGGRLTKITIDRLYYPDYSSYYPDYGDFPPIELNELIPYSGILYDLNKGATLYGSYTDILDPQYQKDSSGNLLPAKRGHALEVGIKKNWGDKFVASACIFRILQDDLATADGSNKVLNTQEQAYITIEGATSRGFEFELLGNINEDWAIQLGWTQYEIKDADGTKQETHQPRRLFRGFTTYKLPSGLDQWSVGLGISWDGEAYTGNFVEESYYLVDAMVKYQHNNNLSVQLNIENLLDETYYTNLGLSDAINFGEPISGTLGVRYSF